MTLVVLVVQISVSNKSYGCVDGIHTKDIVKNSYFECFPVILYVPFIRYHPVGVTLDTWIYPTFMF